jgi:hypothetical protein
MELLEDEGKVVVAASSFLWALYPGLLETFKDKRIIQLNLTLFAI